MHKHCSGGDALLGSVPVWASIIILLVIGFVVGLLSGIGITLCFRRRRASCSIESAQNAQQGDYGSSGWLPLVLRPKRPSSVQLLDSRLAGPLSAGMQGDQSQPQPEAVLSFNPSAFRAPALHLRHQTFPVQEARPAAGHEIDHILGAPEDSVGNGTIKASHTDRRRNSSLASYKPMPPLSTSIAAAKTAQKAKDAEAVGDSYDLEDLDDEWKELLCQIDARLHTLGKQSMDSHDRAVAIKSLLVSTARETPEQALAKAILDVERRRRAIQR